MSKQQNETEPTSLVNSGYGSSDETATLLLGTQHNEPKTRIVPTLGSKAASVAGMSTHSSTNGPTGAGNKPVLIRQDRTSTYLASPQLSAQGGSEESAAGGVHDDDNLTALAAHNAAARSVPDIELHCNLETPIISVYDAGTASDNSRAAASYQLVPYNRCRACRNCDRRASTAPMSSTVQLTGRSASKESVTMYGAGSGGGGRFSPSLAKQQSASIPPVLITSSPTGSRIIRQSSQPEQSSIVCCGAYCAHAHTAPNVSLQRLKDPSDGIAGIAADSLRINGAMKPFKQVSFCWGAFEFFTVGTAMNFYFSKFPLLETCANFCG